MRESVCPMRDKTAAVCSISLAFCLVLLFTLFEPGLLKAAPPTQIFVLHSYSQEYTWTRRQHEGFMKALAEDSQVNAVVSTEYLDTKRRAYDPPYANEFAAHLRHKYSGYKPAAIYVSDDDALLFARDYLSQVFPRTPVFFSGVNDYDVRNSLDPAFFTGVFERQEAAPNIEWLLKMDKDANDLVFIGDGSNTYRAIAAEVRNDLAPYSLRTTFIADKRLDSALALLRELPGKYLFLTTVGGMTDAEGGVLPLKDILKSLALSGRIVISMEDGYIMEGVLGGYVTSGQKHGMNAARLMLEYLHGKPVIDLPPMLKSPNALIFDDRVLQQYAIDLPESLRKQAILLHPRPDFYRRYSSLILGGLIGLAVLLFLVVLGSAVVLSYKNRELGHARRNAEATNALFNQLAVQSRTVHWEADANGLYTYVSPVSYDVLGYRPEEIIGKKHLPDLLSREESSAGKTPALEYFARRTSFHDLENTTIASDGRIIWVSINGIPVLDDDGTFLGYRGSSTDITERKKAQQALQESEVLFRRLFNQSPMGIAMVSPDYRFLMVNEELCRITGYSEEELQSRTFADITHPEGLANDIAKTEQLKADEIDHYDIDKRYIRSDGSYVWCHLNLRLIRDSKGQPLYFLPAIMDITERKQAEQETERLEAQLLQSQKMEAVGQLAGGVAHDFNNILAAIMSFGYLLTLKLKGNDAVAEYVSEIMRAAERAAALTQSLLAFGRKQHSNPKPVHMNEIIQNTEKILARTIGEDIQFKMELTEENTTVHADGNQLAQILMNLAANARDAMPKGGALTITTDHVFLDEAFMKMHGYGRSGSGNWSLMTNSTGAGKVDFAAKMEASTAPAISMDRPKLTSVLSGSNLLFSWPCDHIGWKLQVQTNISGGIIANGSNWYTITDSSTNNSWTLPIDRTKGSVFSRLINP